MYQRCKKFGFSAATAGRQRTLTFQTSLLLKAMQNNNIASRACLKPAGGSQATTRVVSESVLFRRLASAGSRSIRGLRRGSIQVGCAGLLGLALFGAAHAQDTAVGFQAKRVDLHNRLSSRETELANPKLSSAKRRQLQADVANIKNRLDNGDFKTGDLLVVTVDVENKPSVDTATVRDGGLISISRVPDVSVAGTLRSEVEDKVKKHVGTYFRSPEVRVNFTTRVTVVGAVGRKGSFNVSPDRPLSEIITVAGGGLPNAKLDQLEVRRGGKTILSKKASKKLLIDGVTVEQAGIQNGDEVEIPGKRVITWQAVTQTIFLISSLTFALINFLRYYYASEE
ncbi:MAG: SLBB domain-containing protein [Phycisphaerae bacterium]|nr:SLBB domain-containing protein [Gemmatimonadaceae bacterium]